MTKGENTDLVYTFEDGWSVEVHGARTHGDHNQFYTATFAVVNPHKEEVYEGELTVRPDQFTEPPSFYRVLCGVLYGLRQDYHRVMWPHRFDAPDDRGIVIAFDEAIALWLRCSEQSMITTALEEVAGSTRAGRRYYSDGKFERARTVG